MRWSALCLLLFACDDASDPPPADAGVHPFSVVAETKPAWMGVWGVSTGPVWFVGGTPAEGSISRADGAQVEPEMVPAGPHLWWIWGADADRIWACGAGGRVLRRSADGWAAEETGLGEDAILWGLWGSGPDDLWAVGGTQAPNGPRGIVLRSTGDGVWTRVLDPALPLEDPDDEFAGLNLYKVWGSGPDDVHLVGEGGIALHWDGAGFSRVETDTREILFTVHGQPGLVLAVGGLSTGVVRRFDGGAWVDDGAPEVLPLNGVFVEPNGAAWVTGARGVVLRRSTAGAWTRLRSGDPNIGDRTLHAIWVGKATWTVGGDLVQLRDGVLASDTPR